MPYTHHPTNAKLHLLTKLPLSLTNFVFIIFFLFAGCTDTVSARNTLLIVGHSSNNVYKMALAEQLIHNFSRIDIDYSKEFTVFENDDENADISDRWNQKIGRIHFRDGDISRLIVSKRGTDQMSLTLISQFYEHVKTDNPMIVVEIGYEAIQTRALLTKGALCWGLTRADISSPNRAYLCNDVYLPENRIIDTQNVTAIDDYEEYTFNIRQPERRLWPCIFASAIKVDRKHKQKQMDIDGEEEVEDLVDKIMEDITERKYQDHSKENEADDRLHTHKLHCKYRKSCYETGDIPQIEKYDSLVDRMSGWFNKKEGEKEDETEVQLTKLNRTDLDGDGIPDSEDDDVNLTPLKFKCKYRVSCYKQYGIPSSKADEEQDERRSILARSAPQPGKKKTLKDIAERTVKKVREAEEKAASRPMSKASVTERILDKIEEQLTKKLNCKYRKTCYETGVLPEIDLSYHIPLMSTYFVQPTASQNKKPENEPSVEDLEEIEKKVYCKYRKSCYESGVKPIIEPEIQINSIRDLRELPDMIETRKLTIQERCKYRKSCYISGVLPDLHAHQMEKVILKEVSSVIPTSVTALKELCKYRKSCYNEIAESATVDTVKHIRKRRLIEKEVRKRALRRARLRRKLKIDMEDHHGHHRRTTRKEKKADRSKELNEETEKSIKAIEKEQIDKKARSTEEPLQKGLEGLQESEIKRKKKTKKTKNAEPETPVDMDTTKVVKSKKLNNIPENDAETDTKEKKKRGTLKKTKEVAREEYTTQDDKPQKEEPSKKIKKKKDYEPAAETTHPIKEKRSTKNRKQEDSIDAQQSATKTMEVTDIADDDWKHSKKEKCKYRRSCYESGEAPKIEQSVASLFNSFSQHVNSEYDRESRIQRSEVDHKLDCKYRKSCYETGYLPDLTITAELVTPHEFRDGLTARKLKCKYRKSCYEDQEIEDSPERTLDHEEARKPANRSSRKLNHSSRDKKAEKTKQKNDDEDELQDDDDEKEEKADKIGHPAKERHAFSELGESGKNDCKYRKSCYQGVEPRAKNEDHSGTIARTEQGGPLRTKCNVYYLSCREQMGLPPKENAPMGPNGRRLCRKKKD